MPEQPNQPPAKKKSNAEECETEKLRINRAFQLAVVGLALAAAVVGILLAAGWKTASEVTAVVGVFTSVLGTLVGAFFGLQIGSAGKEEADKRADNAQKKVDVLFAAADENTILKAGQHYPGLFK